MDAVCTDDGCRVHRRAVPGAVWVHFLCIGSLAWVTCSAKQVLGAAGAERGAAQQQHPRYGPHGRRPRQPPARAPLPWSARGSP
eukprot:275060-Chlamydomonas_euryale.AAC.1